MIIGVKPISFSYVKTDCLYDRGRRIPKCNMKFAPGTMCLNLTGKKSLDSMVSNIRLGDGISQEKGKVEFCLFSCYTYDLEE